MPFHVGPAGIQLRQRSSGVEFLSIPNHDDTRHSLFDAGAFTVLPKLEIIVARIVDKVGVNKALHRFDGQPLRATPKVSRILPSTLFLKWHTRESSRNSMKHRWPHELRTLQNDLELQRSWPGRR